MRWALNQKGWRALLLRLAFLTALWLAVAFVFATEIYVTARGGPLRISWTDAASNAFRDWFPWILLSPAAVLLASRFRFDRRNWQLSLLVHFVAVVLFALAYEGLELLVAPGPFILSTGMGVVSTGDARPPGMAGFRVFNQRPGAPPPPFPVDSNAPVLERVIGVHGATLSLLESSNGAFFVQAGEGRTLPVPGPGFTGAVQVGPPGRWPPLLHLTLVRTRFTAPIYVCIVCLCWVFNYFQEANERERRTFELESRLTQANLQALKMQLQPHFLFNTLNAISSLIHESPDVADDMVGSLSQFLRTTLEVLSKNEIPLHSELEFVERYLNIQQIRFGDRLRIRREVEPHTLNALVPPLLLQPLVENAIRYGVEPRETGGTVTIQAFKEADALRLEISDDGEGFRNGQLLSPGHGVGLSNTKARLQTLYGDQHQFKLTANQPTGARVKIEVPFRLSPDANEASWNFAACLIPTLYLEEPHGRGAA